VLAAQGDTDKVRHELRPLVVVMAGGDIRSVEGSSFDYFGGDSRFNWR
jgi:hypothetical protein